MNEIIKLILSLSLSGSILAIIILALKPFVKHKLSKSIQYYIWLIVLLRLVLPFSLEGSIMNNVFYGEKTTIDISSPGTVLSIDAVNKSINESNKSTDSSSLLPGVDGNLADGFYDADADHNRYFRDLFIQYVLYLWITGVIITLLANLIGYARFAKHLKQANKPAGYEETQLLASLVKGKNIRFVRNHFLSTPLLVGIIRPYIIIPDKNYNTSQLKNILLHEMSHLRRFDIGVKWLTMIAASIHWFNPLMYVIKKEINNACELACDEAVIKDFSSLEKQTYGDTLISVAAEHEYPLGALQVTMYEEKRNLKERLIAIMNHNQKSRFAVIFSVVLVGVIIFGAVYLGAVTFADKIFYKEVALEQIVTHEEIQNIASQNVSGKPTCGIRVSGFKNYATIIPSKGQKVEIISVEKSENVGIDVVYDIVYLADSNAPPEGIAIEFLNLLSSPVGFVQKPRQIKYDLTEIAKYRTPYLGDNSKVYAIVSRLPVPDNYFKQQYISLVTDGSNILNVYYEVKEGAAHSNAWPVANPENPTYSNMRKNALVLFCMIDNLNEVIFAFRNSPSDGKLDTSKYDTEFNFKRASVQDQFGNLSIIGGDLDKLQDALIGENIYAEPYFTNQEVAAARAVVEEYFRAVKAKDSNAILKTLTPRHNAPNMILYGEETITLLTVDYNPEDPMRQGYITNGRGSVKGIKQENVIVFKVSFNVEYPKGIIGPFNEGKYKDWSVILIRDDKDSPWLIDDQGY